MFKTEPKKSVNSHNILYARVATSGDTSERTIIFVEETNGNSIVTYVLFKEQISKLKSLGINVENRDLHHLAQKVLKRCLISVLKEKPSIRRSKAIECGIEFKSDNKLLRKLRAIEEEIAFNLVVSLPSDIHQIYNRIFRECLVPEEILSKLNKILEEQKLSGNPKNDVIDLFSFIAILVNDVFCIDTGNINKLKNSKDAIVTTELLKMLQITKEEVQKYVADLFLYPIYWKRTEHFNIIVCFYRNYKK
ncbi:MAG: hypothetical protein U9P70_05460 [Patescibacteria group bacterium]|nr:hypothetical protein [Patescibacteria group bacterium]